MQILDKYGYLESALGYIEKQIISGKGLQKIAKKTGINEDLLKNLSLALKGFSEKQVLTSIAEKLEEGHSSLSGAIGEIDGTDLSVELQGNKAFVLLTVVCDIVSNDETEDKIKLEIQIISKNNIKI